MNRADFIRQSNLHKFFIPFYSGIGHVLMFHRVTNEKEYTINKDLQVTPEYLESVIKYFIANKIDIINLDECFNRITSKGKVKRFVVFTLDDGYADNLNNALPVFEKYSSPFTIFLTTGYPDNNIVLWWYLLEYLVLNNNKIEFTNGTENYFYNTIKIDEKKVAFSKIRRFIMDSASDNLLSNLNNIFSKYYVNLYELTKKMALSWKQIIELSYHPLVTIGAHTVNHLVLSKLSEEKVMKEITDSIQIIEGKIGKKVEYMSYPFGGSTEAGAREFKIAENCNIKMAFTSKNSNIFKYHSCKMTSLPRIGVDEQWSISHIDLYINGLTPFLDTHFR